jgi:hypothetical protein
MVVSITPTSHKACFSAESDTQNKYAPQQLTDWVGTVLPKGVNQMRILTRLSLVSNCGTFGYEDRGMWKPAAKRKRLRRKDKTKKFPRYLKGWQRYRKTNILELLGKGGEKKRGIRWITKNAVRVEQDLHEYFINGLWSGHNKQIWCRRTW